MKKFLFVLLLMMIMTQAWSQSPDIKFTVTDEINLSDNFRIYLKVTNNSKEMVEISGLEITYTMKTSEKVGDYNRTEEQEERTIKMDPFVLKPNADISFKEKFNDTNFLGVVKTYVGLLKYSTPKYKAKVIDIEKYKQGLVDQGYLILENNSTKITLNGLGEIDFFINEEGVYNAWFKNRTNEKVAVSVYFKYNDIETASDDFGMVAASLKKVKPGESILLKTYMKTYDMRGTDVVMVQPYLVMAKIGKSDLKYVSVLNGDKGTLKNNVFATTSTYSSQKNGQKLEVNYSEAESSQQIFEFCLRPIN
ncbi:MAG: hypothetical protein JXR07_08780 [Reichenbachiella sp.]